jgi:arylsulfatase A-like enzyme
MYPNPNGSHIRISFLLYLWLSALLWLPSQGLGQPVNILVLLSDDHDQRAISAYQKGLISTPNLDKIARDGVLFAQSFVTNSICAPSRAVLLTGKHSHINGQKDNGRAFDGSQATLPKYFREAGYHTALFGKWHLVSDPTGFDHWEILQGQGQYYNPIFLTSQGKKTDSGYVSTLITAKAKKWLVHHNAEMKKPFFLMVQHKSPHRNWMPPLDLAHSRDNQNFPLPQDFDQIYTGPAAEQTMEIGRHMLPTGDLKIDRAVSRGLKIKGWDLPHDSGYVWNEIKRMKSSEKQFWQKLMQQRAEDFASKLPTGKALDIWKYQWYLRDYLSCVEDLDREIGKMLNLLDSLHLSENTLVIYTSDQGFWLGDKGWFDKRWMYETSMRTPLLLRFPGKVAKGQICSRMVQNLDITPTLLEAAQLPVPEAMQGLSFWKEITGGKAKPREAIYYRYYEYPQPHQVRPHYGIRTTENKIIYFPDLQRWELYNLKTDPGEKNNLADLPEWKPTLEKMKTELFHEKSRLSDNEP